MMMLETYLVLAEVRLRMMLELSEINWMMLLLVVLAVIWMKMVHLVLTVMKHWIRSNIGIGDDVEYII